VLQALKFVHYISGRYKIESRGIEDRGGSGGIGLFEFGAWL
jgi:hypothetical protein